MWTCALAVVCLARAPFAAPAPTLPEGWSAIDVGIVGTQGAALGRGGAFILRGAGSSIGDRADSFRFVYRALSGDGEIVAQVAELTAERGNASAGVMLRDSLTATARFAYMSVSAQDGLAFQRRGEAQADAGAPEAVNAAAVPMTAVRRNPAAPAPLPPSRRATSPAVSGAIARPPVSPGNALPAVITDGGAGLAPAFVRLVRKGDSITAYRSADGLTWRLVGSDTLALGATIQAGLVVNSRDLGSLATATFSGVRITAGTVAPAPAPVTTPPAAPIAVPPASTTPPQATAPAVPGTPAPDPVAPPPSTPASPPDVTPAEVSIDPGQTVRLLHWNVHHGFGTDGVFDPDRIAGWIAAIAPNIVSLNEVNDAELAETLRARLEQRTGQRWSSAFSGWGNQILTRLQVLGTSICAFNPAAGRLAAHVSAVAGGRIVNLWSAHLSADSAGERLSEVQALTACANQWPEARMLAGDFNMQASSAEYTAAVNSFSDAWAAARSIGATINYPGNCDGCTRNSRIDYVFMSRGASALAVQSAQVFDTRDGDGAMPSDHKPLLVVYTMR